MGLRFDARTSQIVTDASEVTFADPLITVASVTGAAGLNIPEGVAPSAPVDGDVWVTAAGAFNARLNGVTVDLSASSGGTVTASTGADNRVAVFTTGTNIEGDANFTWDGVDLSLNAGTNSVNATELGLLEGLTTLSGSNTGDQTITLTGDVTGSGTGSFATTIPADSITMDQIVDIATDTFLGRVTAATGTVEVLTNAQAKTALDLTGTNSGDQTITLTGDVTGSGTGSFAATIAADSVTLDKMQDITTDSFLGRTTAATGTVEIMNGSAATALLSAFATASTVQGVVPGSNSLGATYYLDGSGTWSVPASTLDINGLTLDSGVLDGDGDTIPLYSVDAAANRKASVHTVANSGWEVDLFIANETITANTNDMRKFWYKTSTSALTLSVEDSSDTDLIGSSFVVANHGTSGDITVDRADTVTTFFGQAGSTTSVTVEPRQCKLFFRYSNNVYRVVDWDRIEGPYGTQRNKITTADEAGSADNSAGAKVRDGDNNYRNIGFNESVEDANTSTGTITPFAQNNVGQTIYWTGASATNVDTYASTGTTQTYIPDGSVWTLQNNGAGALTFRGGTSVTIRYWSGAGAAPADVDVTIARGGIATVRKVTDTVYDIWGVGLS